MSLDTINLADALKLLSLPRVIGEHEGVEITAQNGRYGPYLRHGTDSRTLTSEDQIFSLTLDEAIEIYKQPKVRRRGVAKPPLKDLGVDPDTKKQIVVKDGRFGAYVTDGDTNATLRRGDIPEAMTLERGLELLAGRRAWELENGDAPKKSSRKSLRKAPTLTARNLKDASSKKRQKRQSSGKSRLTVDT
jgi:DNA topoisomerase-1